MELRPEINDPVVLRDQAGREHRSRVEDLGPELLVVARPHDLPVEEDFGPGAELRVVWATPRGVAVLPTRIVEAHAERSLRLWSLAVTGAGWVEQRRRFVRVPASGRLTLQPRDEEAEVEAVTGHLLDLSEAALRCAVEPNAATTLLTDAPDVVAGFRFGDLDFTIPGHVELKRPSTRPGELTELVVLFDEPVAAADALRKQIFAQQTRTLRAKDGR